MTPFSRHTGLRALATAAAFTLLGAGMAASAATSASASPTEPEQDRPSDSGSEVFVGYVGQFNAWGSAGHWGESDGLVEHVGASVRDREPLALTLQEVCENQIQDLADDLEGYDYVFEPAWDEAADPDDPDNTDRDPVRCEGLPHEESDGTDERYGNAVLFRDDQGFATQGDDEVGRFDLRTQRGSDPEYRSMVCTPSSELDAAVCSTHLSAGDGDDDRANRAIEAGLVAHHTWDAYQDDTVILGADLNMEPSDEIVNVLYHPDYHGWPTGQFRSLMSPCYDDMNQHCMEGESTFGAVTGDARQRTRAPQEQIDYLFADTNVYVYENYVNAPSQNCTNPVYGVDPDEHDHHRLNEDIVAEETIPCSDHELLWSDVTIHW